jgi:nitrogen-specific signal transduction histidine kinase
MKKGIYAFLHEIRNCGCETFNERRGLLKAAFLLSSIFFSLYYSLIIIPSYGISSKIFLHDLFAGSFIIAGFIISLLLSKKLKKNPILSLPSIACIATNLYFLNNDFVYSSKPSLWVFPLVVGTIYAVGFASVRCNLVIAILNTITPLLAVLFNSRLNFLQVAETASVSYFASIIGMYFIYKTTAEKKKVLSDRNELHRIKRISNIGSWRWDLKTDQFFFDNQFYQMLGYSLNEVSNDLDFWTAHIHASDKRRVFVTINKYLNNPLGSFRIKYRLRHKEGYWVSLISQGEIFERDATGKPKTFTGSHIDITTLENIQQEKLEKTKELEIAQKVAKIGSWGYDIESNTITWSKQMYNIFPEEYSQGPPSFEKHRSSIHVDDIPIWERTVQKCVEDGLPYVIKFRTFGKKNPNEVVWVEAHGNGIRDKSGKIIHLTGTCQDISEKVKIETQLEQEKLKIIQASKLASLGEMSAGIAHEINNPLAIIDGQAQLLEKNIADQNKAKGHIEKIHKNINRISTIVKGLKKFSRQSDQVVLTENSLEEIIKESIVIVEAKAKRHGVKISYENKMNDSIINCDEIQLEQVIVNLIANAIDANNEIEDAWVKIISKEHRSCVEISVIDSGKGIPPHILTNLFNPFYTTKEVGVGTGLGLSISTSIIQEHRGSLEYKLNQGHTSFVITLPHLRIKNVA